MNFCEIFVVLMFHVFKNVTFTTAKTFASLLRNFVFCFDQYPGKKALDVSDHPELPAIVRVELWFGLEKYQSSWTARQQSEGEFGVLAETVCIIFKSDVHVKQ